MVVAVAVAVMWGGGVEKKESQRIRKIDLGPGLHQEREEEGGGREEKLHFSLSSSETQADPAKRCNS